MPVSKRFFEQHASRYAGTSNGSRPEMALSHFLFGRWICRSGQVCLGAVILPFRRISDSLARSVALPLDWARKTCPNRPTSCLRSCREINPKSAAFWDPISAASKGRGCNPSWELRSLATVVEVRTPPCRPQTTHRALPSIR